MLRLPRLLFIVTALASAVSSSATAQPNVLIIMADDCTYNDLPMYGGANAHTPHLEQFAEQGLTFSRAYLCSAMCQPCRAELYSGQYPMRNGCAWNHSASRPTTESLPHHLSSAGYRVGLAGKVHVKPQTSFPFEAVAGYDRSCVRDPTNAHDPAGIQSFMERDTDQPFCLVVALVEPHVPWVMGDASQYPPDELELPPNIADNERTRSDYAKYLAEITYMDGQVGEILEVLEETGQSDNTLVLFTSEQGSQFPGCKWTNWDTGVHTALIARWPGHTPIGTRTDALVQYADVVPTLLAAVGIEADADAFDGTSFLPVLNAEASEHRQFVYGMHNNIPEGPAYPIRSISDGEYHYIRNLLPDEIYIEKHLMGTRGTGRLNNPYWATWVWDSWENPVTYNLVKRYTNRPPEQLYHTATDRYEMTNLADNDDLTEIQGRLSDELDRWMAEQGDPGIAQDTHGAIGAAREGVHLFSPPGS